MNWSFFIYSILSFLVSIGLYIENKRWSSKKKKEESLDYFDRGTVIPRNWFLILLFGCIGIIYFFKLLFNI